jgi:hypothetical protein
MLEENEFELKKNEYKPNKMHETIDPRKAKLHEYSFKRNQI